MPSGTNEHHTWTFGDFVLDVDRGSLMRDGQDLQLRPQSFLVLAYLVKQPGVLVTKRELQDAIWGSKAVTDDSLTHCIIDIRRVLGDCDLKLIRTVPRRGYILELEVQEHNSSSVKASPQKSSSRWQLLAGAALLTGLAGALIAILSHNPPSATDVQEVVQTRSKTIAVLPFKDLSEAQNQRYLAHGISEEITNLLAQIDGLQVIARTSAFALAERGIELQEIADRLDVSFMLEGSIQRSGQRIYVTARLIDTATNMHVWSDSYDSESVDFIAVQNEIAGTVTQVLQLTILGVQNLPVRSAGYDTYLRGKFIYNRRGEGDLQLARRHFKAAVEADPELAVAWAGLAGTYFVAINAGRMNVADGTELMFTAARKAVAIDPDLVDGRVRLAQAYMMLKDSSRSIELLRQVFADDPSHPLVLGLLAGLHGARGDYERAIELQQRAARLDPLNGVGLGNLSIMLAADGRIEEAIEVNRRRFDLTPDVREQTDGELAHLYILAGRYHDALSIMLQCPSSVAQAQGLALAYKGLGRHSEARAALDRLKLFNTLPAEIRLAEFYAHLGDSEAAFDILQSIHVRLSDPASNMLDRQHISLIRYSPYLRSLRDDKRWRVWIKDRVI